MHLIPVEQRVVTAGFENSLDSGLLRTLIEDTLFQHASDPPLLNSDQGSLFDLATTHAWEDFNKRFSDERVKEQQLMVKVSTCRLVL